MENRYRSDACPPSSLLHERKYYSLTFNVNLYRLDVERDVTGDPRVSRSSSDKNDFRTSRPGTLHYSSICGDRENPAMNRSWMSSERNIELFSRHIVCARGKVPRLSRPSSRRTEDRMTVAGNGMSHGCEVPTVVNLLEPRDNFACASRASREVAISRLTHRANRHSIPKFVPSPSNNSLVHARALRRRNSGLTMKNFSAVTYRCLI